jgi:hypothetical protein
MSAKSCYPTPGQVHLKRAMTDWCGRPCFNRHREPIILYTNHHPRREQLHNNRCTELMERGRRLFADRTHLTIVERPSYQQRRRDRTRLGPALATIMAARKADAA